MNYLVLKQRIYLVISVLTLIALGSGYGSCTKFSDRLSDSAMVALDSFHHCQYMALSRGLGAAGRRSEQLDYADLLRRHTTAEQLVEIANTDTSRITRLWAYRILLKKADNQVIDVLKQALKDTTYVSVGVWTVADLKNLIIALPSLSIGTMATNLNYPTSCVSPLIASSSSII